MRATENPVPLDFNVPISRISDISRVLVAVVMCGCNPGKVKLISDTWRSDVSSVVFVAPPGCSKKLKLPNTEILQLPSRNFPPSVQTVKTLQYLHKHHMNTYSWFVVVSTETYVNGRLLGSYLSKINSEEKVYLGRPPINAAEDMARGKLVPHERICVGGPGLVLSRAAMHALVPAISNQKSYAATDLNLLLQKHLTAHPTSSSSKVSSAQSSPKLK